MTRQAHRARARSATGDPLPHSNTPESASSNRALPASILLDSVPGIPRKLKEFAYFGFAITLISASIAHFSSGDGILFVIDPLLFLSALLVSYLYFNRINRERSSGSTQLPSPARRSGDSAMAETSPPQLTSMSRSA